MTCATTTEPCIVQHIFDFAFYLEQTQPPNLGLQPTTRGSSSERPKERARRG